MKKLIEIKSILNYIAIVGNNSFDLFKGVYMSKDEKSQAKEKEANIKNFLDLKVKTVKSSNLIKPDLFQKYDVKRGLRNNDGSGVLVGLTSVGDVRGYFKQEHELKPIEGQLRYRGIMVEDLIEGCQKEKRHGFEETAYLLLFGHLPNKQDLAEFNNVLEADRELPEGFVENMILNTPSGNIMNKLARSVLVMYSYDNKPEDRSIKHILRQCIKLISTFPLFVLYGYQAKIHYYDNQTLYIHKIKPNASTAELFLHMLRPDSKYTKMEADILDLMLILHAEHGGGNISTFATHLITSSDTDLYSAIAAAVGSLKGHKHGGANEQVLKMVDNIKEHVSDYSNEKKVEDYLRKIVRKEAFDKTGLIYGMGHAVYTISDPREIVLSEQAYLLAKEKGKLKEYELYKTIQGLAPRILAEEKKSSTKSICANVDFYSGFVYQMLDIPPILYTPLFAISRITGWCAHALEERISGGRIIRPAYKSVLPDSEYTPLNKRTQ